MDLYLELAILTHNNDLSPNYGSILQLQVFPIAQQQESCQQSAHQKRKEGLAKETKGEAVIMRFRILPHPNMPRIVVLGEGTR
jgi:hypothetical protein